ncbi:chemotaxis protein [Brachyspira hyodysenteriae]|uniref:methyl-accepting chemotaxis protein n=1 Tax=Brachyspira hyodysenteriae TaxID=159 RepID=UPI00063D9434|nr:methyl-accepting chemotaxis protein [Brachyspira hyodysenteriae]KLI21631.1 chemotaxis protein [Brachyspira hyodysenteriae]
MKNDLIIKFLAPFVIFLTIVLISVYFIYKPIYRNQFLNSSMSQAMNVDIVAENYLNDIKNDILLLSKNLEISSDYYYFGKFITNVQNTYKNYLSIYFGETISYSKGGMFINTLVVHPRTYDHVSRGWYQDALKTKDIVISAPYLDAASGKIAITFSKAVYTNSNLMGVLGIDFDNMEDLILKAKKYSDYNFYLVYLDGTYVTHNNKDYILNKDITLFNDPIFEEFKDSFSSIDYKIGLVKDEWFFIKRIQDTPFFLVFKNSAKEFYNNFNKIMLSFLIIIVILILLELLLVSKIAIPLSKNLNNAINTIFLMKDGNFNNKFEENELNKSGVAGQLNNSINDMQSSINNLVSQLKLNIQAINNASNEISSGIDNLSNRTSSEAAVVEEISASVESLFSAISSTAKNCQLARDMSYEVTQSANKGFQSVSEITNNMGEIYESSKEISNISKVIQNIAFQTNILALNAAVEAARAGDQGRGFAVVASEIRSLAQNVNEAAVNITNIIDTTVSKIDIGNDSAKNSLNILSEIEKSTNDVLEILVNIASSVNEEEDSVKQIGSSMNELNNITQENSSLASQSSDLGRDIANSTNNLQQELVYFKLE